MTKEYIEKLQSIVDIGDRIGALVFFAMRSNNGIVLKKANIVNDVLRGIASDYRDSLESELNRFESDDNMVVLNLSNMDDRTNVVYRYDISDEHPAYFDIMREPVSDPPIEYVEDKMFNFDSDSFSKIAYFIVLLGTEENHVVIYRDNFNVNLMRQGHGRFYLNKSGTQISKVENDILRMDSQIDCILIDNKFYILNLKKLDVCNDFLSIVRKRANSAIDKIENLKLIDNADDLRNRLDDSIFARRLMCAVQNSPVTELPQNDVVTFVKHHKALSTFIPIKEGKLVLKTKRSQDAFVNLLNDNYLCSKLTNIDYKSSAKGVVEVE